jgi:hypothetical protein
MAAIAVSIIEAAILAVDRLADKRSTGTSPPADVSPNPAAGPNYLLPILHRTTVLFFGAEFN